jgi:hypothetical protein
MSLVESLIRGLSGDDGLGKLGQSLGVDSKTAAMGMAAAAPMILGALQRNASRPDGAQALADALDRDHDGGLLNDLSSFMSQGDTSGGDAILGHVFGNRRQNVDRGVAKAAGIDAATASKLMAMAAPMIMAQLGKAKREQGLNADALAGLLGQEGEELRSAAPGQMGALGAILDADGDGDVDASDLVSRGGPLLDTISNMFKR